MTFEQYLLYIGRDFEEYGYEPHEVFPHIDYFKECHKRELDHKLALEWLYAHINGEEVFEKMKQAPDINLNSDEPCLTIGKLKELLYKFRPEEANLPVFVERIHDHYFENRGWTTLKVSDPLYAEYEEEGGFKDEFIKSWDAVKNENGLLIYNHY